MSDRMKNRISEIIEKENIMVDNDLIEGVSVIGELKKQMTDGIVNTKKEIINNSAHLLIQRIMNEDIEGVIEMLNNNRHVINLFDFTESLNKLITTYGDYNINYEEKYPGIKKIKDTMLLKEKDLLPLLTEIINEKNEKV